MTCPNCGTVNVELIAQAAFDAVGRFDDKPDSYKCCECAHHFNGD